MQAELEQLLGEMIRIDSVNPSLDSKGGGEQSLAAFVAGFCTDKGLECSFQEVDGDRRNVIACVRGKDDEKRLAFVAHLDTVPASGWATNPFEPLRSGSFLHGRGSCDTKASLSAMLLALASIRTERPASTILVVGTVDEEFSKKGARALGTMSPRLSAAVVGEPTSLALVVSHKGSVRWSIETIGQAAHSSKPELGHNAIEDMSIVISDLSNHARRLQDRKDPLVGAPSLTISLISGGTDICTVPARCEITIDRRLVPGEVPSFALREVEAILAEVRQHHTNVIVRSILPAVEDPPLCRAVDNRITTIASEACRAVAGTGDFTGVPYGTDASQLCAAGIPCIVLGPGSIDQAHAVNEFVDVSQVEQAFEIYRMIMLAY